MFKQCIGLSENVWVISLVARWLSISAHLQGTPLGVGDIPVVLPASIAKRVLHKRHVHYPLKIVSSLPPPMELFQNVPRSSLEAWVLHSGCLHAKMSWIELEKEQNTNRLPQQMLCVSWEDIKLGFLFFLKRKLENLRDSSMRGRFAVQACIWVPASLLHPRKKPDVNPQFCNSSAVRGRGRKSPGASWPLA